MYLSACQQYGLELSIIIVPFSGAKWARSALLQVQLGVQRAAQALLGRVPPPRAILPMPRTLRVSVHVGAGHAQGQPEHATQQQISVEGIKHDIIN